jgi:uncharacterized protein
LALYDINREYEMKNSFLFIALFTVMVALQPLFAKVQTVDLPDLTGRVVDRTGTFSKSEISDLETMLEKYEKATGNQMVVAFISSTGNAPIEDYSIDLAEKWKIGIKGKDNGIIILVAKDDRKMRIEVGYGLEGILTDLQTKLIINNIMTPFFRKNGYYSGVKAAVLSIAETTGARPEFKDEYQNTDTSETTSANTTPYISKFKTGSTIITIIIVIIFIGFSLLSNRYGRGYSISGRRRNRNIFFGGDGFGGFDGGGGGGFSGGGGSFGGGGASGSW